MVKLQFAFFFIPLIMVFCSNKQEISLTERQKSFINKLEARLQEKRFDKIDEAISQKWKYITTEQLQEMLRKKENYLLVDARSHIEYRDSHIPGAISIPASDIPKSNNLPVELDSLLIFYCNGPKCTKSKKAARKAVLRGYTNILVYDDGIPEWRKRGLETEGEKFPTVDIPLITAPELEEIKSKVFLIDLRDADEYNKSTIDGTSLNIPLDKIDELYKQIDGNKEIVIFDHTGKQTLLGGRLLYKYGFTKIKRLSGGWVEWLNLKKG